MSRMGNVVQLKQPAKQIVTITIEDFGKSFTLSAVSTDQSKSEQELIEKLRSVFGSWTLYQQEKHWQQTKEKLNSEIDAMPWWRRIFHKHYT